MSGSPKYTTAAVRAAAQAQLIAQQRAREAARRAAAAAAQQARLQVQAAKLRSRLTAVTSRVDLLLAEAHQVGMGAEAQAVRAEAAAVGKRLGAVPGEQAVKQAAKAVAGLERRLAALAPAVAGALAEKQRRDAVTAVRDQLAAAGPHAAFDPEGALRVAGLLSQAEAAAPGSAFASVFRALAAETTAHLAAAAANRAAFEDLRARAEAAGADLDRVLAEAAAEGAPLRGVQDARFAVGRLRQVAGGDWPGAGALASAEQDLAQVTGATRTLGADLEVWLRMMDRIAAVAGAVIDAAPKAGLRLVPGSLVRDGDRVTFRTERTDDESAMTVEVGPTGHGEVEIVYHGSGPDFRTAFAADGEEKHCDLTEEVLDRLHTELDAADIETDGLRWEGKPTGTLQAAQARPGVRPKQRER